MAYKDEYEVARLYSTRVSRKTSRRNFEGDYELRFNLAPPLLSKRDPHTGEPQKREFGPWMLTAFRCSRRCAACAARRWTCSATPPSVAASARTSADYERSIDTLLPRFADATTTRCASCWRCRCSCAASATSRIAIANSSTCAAAHCWHGSKAR
jgi:indolepyruvate ferredoxin oxidoreductase